MALTSVVVMEEEEEEEVAVEKVKMQFLRWKEVAVEKIPAQLQISLKH